MQLMRDLDRFSRKILQELENDGRLSNTELAARVGLSPSACLRRVQELERNGVIRGYRAVIDRESTGRSFIVIVAIALSDHQSESQRVFEQAVLSAPEVRECHNIAGVYEYILHVEVADLEAYKRFHSEVLGVIPPVKGITSFISMETVKDSRDFVGDSAGDRRA